MKWQGWLWTAGRWSRVTEGSTIGECAHRLGILGDERGIPCRFQAMTQGSVPPWTPTMPRKASCVAQDASPTQGGLAAAAKCQRASRAEERGYL